MQRAILILAHLFILYKLFWTTTSFILYCRDKDLIYRLKNS